MMRFKRYVSKLESLKAETGVAVLNLGNVSLGFLLQLIVLRSSGTFDESDAYFATAGIVALCLSVAVHVASGAITPQLARLVPHDRVNVVWTLVGVVAVVGIPISLLLAFTAPLWATLLFPGFADRETSELVALAAASVLALPFAIGVVIIASFLYAEERFLTSELIAVGASAGLVVAAFFLIPQSGIRIIGWLVLARFMVQFAVLLTRVPMPIATGDVRAIAMKSRALFFGATYFKSDLLVDRLLLSLAPAGALSMITFGQSILTAASGVLGQALANTVTAKLSLAHEARDGAGFRALLRRNLALTGIAVGGLLVASVLMIPTVVDLVVAQQFEGSGLSLELVLVLFAGLPIGACFGTLFANAFYALGDTRTPTLITIVTFTAFLVSKVFIFANFGIEAFCALTSFYYLLNAFLLAWVLSRKLQREFDDAAR